MSSSSPQPRKTARVGFEPLAEGAHSGALSRASSRHVREHLDAVLSARAGLQQLSASIGKVQADLDRAVGHLEEECAAPERLGVPDLRANVSAVPGDLSGQSWHESAVDERRASTPSRAGTPSRVDQTSDIEWPTSLAPRMEGGRPSRSTCASTAQVSLNIAEMLSSQEERAGGSGVPWYVLHPDSYPLFIWNFMSVVLLTSDMVFVPWSLAWDIPIDGTLLVIACIICSFWTLDIVLTFFTAFSRHGEIVVDLRSIRMRYLKSWFLLDATIVSCDLVAVLLATSSGFKLFRFAKVGRLIRINGMARMIKMYTAVSDFMEFKLSGYSRLAFRFVKMLFVTLVFSHSVACMWYYIGREAPTNTGQRWTHASFEEDIPGEDMWYQYFTCLHWAMAQLSLGGIEVISVSTLERVYSIVALITGLLFGSMLVSTLSTSMFEVTMDKRELSQKMQLLRRFLRERGVQHSLATQVEQQVFGRFTTKKHIAEENVVGLQLLSASLFSKLKLDLFGPYLKHHPLFHVCLHVDLTLVEVICRTCMGHVSLRSQDDLFRAGNMAECTYFFIGGGLEYEQDPASSFVPMAKVRDISAGSWIAEAALWSHWVHVGTARATQAAELAGLWPERLKESLQRSSLGVRLVCDYAKQFHRLLQTAKPPATAFPDDLEVPLTDWSDMVFSMGEQSQVVIGSQAIQSCAVRSWKATSKTLAKLQAELTAGKCAVMLNSTGKMERVVPVVLLEIRSGAGKTLMQLGKVEAGEVEPCWKLPGGKQQRGELSYESVNRLLDMKMASVADRLQVIGYKRDTRFTVSPEFGVNTKYLRCTAILSLDGEIAGENVLVLPPIAPAELPPFVGSGSVSSLPHAHASPIIGEARARSPQFVGSLASLSSSIVGSVSSLSRAHASPIVGSVPTVASSTSLRRISGSSQESADDGVATLMQRDIFCVHDVHAKGTAGLYAWFTEHEIQEFARFEKHPIYPRWVSTIYASVRQMRAEHEPPQAEHSDSTSTTSVVGEI